MLKFRKIDLSDKERADKALRISGFRGCEYTFGNNFVWSVISDTEVCFENGLYICKQGSGNKTWFTYPSGGLDVKSSVEPLKEYTRKNSLPLKIYANKDVTREITELYPSAKAELSRDYCDYICLSEDLAEFKGRKFHSKRNHLNRFYENDWSFEKLTIDEIPKCREFLKLWMEENISSEDFGGDDKKKREELSVVERSLECYEALGYAGGVLRVNGEMQAFTFGERSSEDCFVIHVEKALRKYQGAYTAVRNQFVKSLGGRYKYINLEDDSGSENLRKSKLSYHPVFLEEKYFIRFDD